MTKSDGRRDARPDVEPHVQADRAAALPVEVTSATNGPAVRWGNRGLDGRAPHPAVDEGPGNVQAHEETPLPDGTPVARVGLFVVTFLDWQDQDFERAFDRARAVVAAEGLIINGPKSAMHAEELLHAAGYPHARVGVKRTVDEGMAHSAGSTVWREGQRR